MSAAYGIAMPTSRGVLNSVCYCTPAINFFNRLTTQPTAARKTLYDTLFRALIAAGVLTKLDVLYLFAAADSATALTNLVQSSYGGGIHGSVTLTADQGAQSDGSTGYIDTGFIASSAGGQYALNSASAGAWSLTAGATGGVGHYTFGASDGTNLTQLNIRTNTNVISSNVNDATAGTVANSTTDGFFTLSRTSSSGWDISRNASSLATITQSSVALPTVSIAVLARNISGTAAGFDNKQLAVFFLGAGLSSTDLTNLYNALHAYLQAVAGVA